MDRTMHGRPRAGVLRLPRRRRWRWAAAAVAVGACAALPLALSLAIVLPLVLLVVPAAVLGLAVWAGVRRLDSAPRRGAPPAGPRTVIPLHEARAALQRRRSSARSR